MTEVTSGTQQYNGNTYRYLKCRNHSGNDAVCNGISTICYALTGYLLNKLPDDELEYDLRPGDAMVTIKDSDLAKEAFDMAVIGLLQIEVDNKEYIHVVTDITL